MESVSTQVQYLLWCCAIQNPFCADSALNFEAHDKNLKMWKIDTQCNFYFLRFHVSTRFWQCRVLIPEADYVRCLFAYPYVLRTNKLQIYQLLNSLILWNETWWEALDRLNYRGKSSLIDNLSKSWCKKLYYQRR